MPSLPWKENFKIRTFDVDFTNHARVSSIMAFMQEAASNSAEDLSFGYDDLIASHLFWVLSRLEIQFERFPTLNETITIETWPKGVERLFANRDFRIYADEGPIARATSAWLMIDKHTMRPVKPDVLLHKIPDHSISPALSYLPDKIKEPESKSPGHTIQIGYSEIDINQHVNNVKYIDLTFNDLPREFFLKYQIKAVKVNYLNQLLFGDTLKIFKSIPIESSRSLYFEGQTQQDQKVFQLVLETEEIA